MDSPYKEQLYTKANEFIKACAPNFIHASIVPDSLREYNLKLSIQINETNHGFANIYYSPKKGKHTLTVNEIKDSSITAELNKIWQNPPTLSDIQNEPKNNHHFKDISVYVDGSYYKGKTGYGAVILDGEKVIQEISGKLDNAEVEGTRQVAGELFAAMESIKWCQNNQIKSIKLYYDYMGIENWATGVWKANIPVTQNYKNFIKNSDLTIDWIKVKSHSGNKWNDIADKLAKNAIA
ncbi:MAG: hypothetical protein KDK90_08045 [Leptospiraceae bacterium]|nr:hypothetical protein [Leptospiraceae bacterium]